MNDIKEYVKINSDDLEGECLTLPEKFCYIYDLYSEADNRYTLFSEGVEGLRASKYLYYRQDMLDNGLKPTDKLVENCVTADKEVSTKTEQKFKLKKERDILYGLVQAMNSKREMIKTLSFLRKDDTRYAS